MPTPALMLIDTFPIHVSANPSDDEIQRAAENWAFDVFAASVAEPSPMSLDGVSLAYDNLADQAERLIRERLARHPIAH